MFRGNDFLLGALVGAGLMYFLDPDRGRRRRALLRDQIAHAGNELEGLGDAVASQARHLTNQAGGMVAETRARVMREEVDDVTLTARVRSELGRLVSNPSSIGVSADHGRITLTGPILTREVDSLIDGVESIRGVADVINRLQVHEQPGDVPGLQGRNS
jgi:osmotically-inducible protein OsmY